MTIRDTFGANGLVGVEFLTRMHLGTDGPLCSLKRRSAAAASSAASSTAASSAAASSAAASSAVTGVAASAADK